MKRPLNLIVLLALATLFTCCDFLIKKEDSTELESKDVEGIINSHIKELVQNNISWHKYSYTPVETKIDSAFAPYDDPIFQDYVIKSIKVIKEKNEYIETCEMRIGYAEDGTNTYAISSSYVNKARKEKAKYLAEIEENKKEIEQIKADITKRLDNERKFIGFKVNHTYSATDFHNSYPAIEYIYCLFDKELKNIIVAYDMEGEDYTSFTNFMQQLNNEETNSDK